MSTQKIFTGQWASGTDKITVNLPMIEFEEDGCKIIYCPALDVSGYGKNAEEANESFLITMGEFFLYGLHKKTLVEELKSMGWIIKHNNKKMQAPEMSKLLTENENFKRIFDNFDYQKFNKQVEIPVS